MSDSLVYGLSEINTDYKLICEFGVWYGRTIKTIRETLDTSFKIFGFDSFVGMPEHPFMLENARIIKEDDISIQYANNETIDVILKPGCFSVDGQIPDVNDVIFYKGWFDDTLPEFVKDNPIEPAALIYIDCDHYLSTVTVLNYMTPYIQKDTILVFDEWKMDIYTETVHHEQKAFYEWASSNNISYKFLDYQDNSQSFNEERKIIKIL